MKKLLLIPLFAFIICPFGLCLVGQPEKEVEIIRSCPFVTAGPAMHLYELQQSLPDVDVFNDDQFDCPIIPTPPTSPKK